MLFYALSFFAFFFFYIKTSSTLNNLLFIHGASFTFIFFIFFFHGLNMNQFNIVKGFIHVKALYELIVCFYANTFFTDVFHQPPKFMCLQHILFFFYLFSSFLSWGIFRKFNFSQFKYLLAYYETHIYFILIPKPNNNINNNNKTHPRVPTSSSPTTSSFFRKY